MYVGDHSEGPGRRGDWPRRGAPEPRQTPVGRPCGGGAAGGGRQRPHHHHEGHAAGDPDGPVPAAGMVSRCFGSF